MRVRVKSREALIKYFTENRYHKGLTGGYSNNNLLFTKGMFEECGKSIEVGDPNITGYHYRCDDYSANSAYGANYHKDWVRRIGELHMKEIDI